MTDTAANEPIVDHQRGPHTQSYWDFCPEPGTKVGIPVSLRKILQIAVIGSGLVAGASTIVGPPSLAAGSTLTWAAPVRVDYQPPFAGELVSGVSCPDTGLCVAVGGNSVMTSTHPTGGASAWAAAIVPGTNNSLDSVSCPNSNLCVAVGTGTAEPPRVS